MRIKGSWGEFEAPYVIAFLISDDLNIRKPVEFLIDTGASRTTILDSDAIRLGIDYSKLQRFKQGTVGIGGVVDTYILPNARLVFPIPDGVHEERIKKIPSLLGRDFLNRYTLALDRKRGSVSITDQPAKT